MTDYERLVAHFSDPERYRAITSAPGFDGRKAIWLTDENIRAMANDPEFMATFNALAPEPYYVDSPASVREDPSDAPLSDAHSCRPPWAKP